VHFNIADLFESLADAIPDRPALVCGDRRLTYAELDVRATRLANALRARGVKAGDHLGLYLYNSAEFVEAVFAAFKLRAVPININYRYVDDELSFLFRNADLVALLHQRELTPRVAAVAAGVPALRTFVAVEDGSDHDLAPLGAARYEDLMAGASAARDFGPRSGDDHYIIYTGGTTGMPRGVIRRHEDVFFAGLQGGNPGGAPIESPEELGPAARDREAPITMLPAAPFIHGAAQWAAIIGLFTGGKVVVAPGRRYDARLICRLIAAEGVNTITVVGDAMARPLVEALSEPGAAYDMSSLMVLVSAGAVLSENVKEELQALLPHAMVLNSFGATEAGHQGTTYPGGSPRATGRPTFFMDDSNTVLGDDLRPLEPGSGVVGKLARRGRLPIGYYNDPEKTAATFPTIDGERWVLPGDLATIEADGQITVFGRGAVCINSGGEKIFPEEVEAVLKAHPAVEDAVVVGLPDDRWGQRVAAVVQPRPGAEVTLALLDAHCRASIAGYKVPRQLRVVPEIVRHPSGKPDYRWAREAALAEG
jgi:3-oxocholest-4-en-26-oate---CoA ligase